MDSVITPQPGDCLLLDDVCGLWSTADDDSDALREDVERVVICLKSYERPHRLKPLDANLASRCAHVWFDGGIYWIFRRHIKAVISPALVAQPGRAAC